MHTSSRRWRLYTGMTMLATLASSAAAQTIDHRRSTLSPQTHAVVHLDEMSKMLKRMDSTLAASRETARQLSTRLHQMPDNGTAAHGGVMPQFTSRMISLTDELQGLAASMREMMQDPSMLRDRAMQNDMERIQRSLASMTYITGEAVDGLEQMVRRIEATHVKRAR